MSIDLVGRTCVSVRRVHHRFADRPPSTFGPVEFAWKNGAFTTLDVNTDWTLSITDRPWVDPFITATAAERRRLALEVGLWERAEADDLLRQVIGQRVERTEAEQDEVGGSVGLKIVFQSVVLIARLATGHLAVSAQRRL